MKTILVDAIDCLIDDEGVVFEEMLELLETFPNRKIILTGANDEQMEKFGLFDAPYEVFTLKHDPEKTETKYYEVMLEHFGLSASDVVYFEHSEAAAEGARSVGITTYHYDEQKKDLKALKDFLSENM